MGERPTWCGDHERSIREWQFLLLRFAITRNDADRSHAIAKASDLDLSQWLTFTFFARTTDDICDAIVTMPGESAQTVLNKFAARIEDTRLRAAFCACLGLESSSLNSRRKRAAWRESQNLWKGLPGR